MVQDISSSLGSVWGQCRITDAHPWGGGYHGYL